MRFGRGACPRGFLPIFSVDTEEEAHALLTAACPLNLAGEFVARELAHEQTLESLEAFAERLRRIYGVMQKRKAGA